MVSLLQPTHGNFPSNPCEMLLRNVSQLQIANQLICGAVAEVRHEYQSSPELIKALDAILALCDHGRQRISPTFSAADAVSPITLKNNANPALGEFLIDIPKKSAPGTPAVALISNLRFLAQNLEVKIKIVAEKAAVVGENRLSTALLDWSAAWRLLGQELQIDCDRLKGQIQFSAAVEAATLRTAA